MMDLTPDQAPRGSDWIIAELAEVRRRAAQGELPAFRRGQMFFDYSWNKVRIAAATERCAR